MIVDAHHHLWRFDAAEYPWIGEDDSVLRRDFLEGELAHMAAAAGIEATIAVQARQSLAETAWLLDLASRSRLIRGVVGWVPLDDPRLYEVLDRVAPVGSRLVGARHVVQDEEDPEFLLRPEIERGIATLTKRGLAYDLLIREHQLPQAMACVDAHPAQRFVLDHCAKPDVRRVGSLEHWSRALRELARRPNVWCKLSGLVTEAHHSEWITADLRPWVEIVLDAFVPSRVMYGSDWPVCLLADGARWPGAARELLAALAPSKSAAVFGDNAMSCYRLGEHL